MSPDHRQTARAYIIGFGLSLALTFAAYALVVNHTSGAHAWFSYGVVLALISFLAVTQFIVQLVSFLHLGRGPKSGWNLLAFAFMVLVLGILVIGSLWIMQNLNYHMTPSDAATYLLKDEGFQK